MGSNQRLIQPQTVGKKEGAPMICGVGRWVLVAGHGMAAAGGDLMCVGYLQKFGLGFRDSVLSLAGWHLACDSADSRTA